MPVVGGNYETIVISLQDDLLRKITLEEKLEADRKYNGPSNILIPSNEFLKGYFQSIVPYARNSGAAITDELGILKVKEGSNYCFLRFRIFATFFLTFLSLIIENLSGHSMDDVKVYYNDNVPAQLQSQAYTEGTDIHIGPNQERHLPHEAWYIVQQKEGRIKSTFSTNAETDFNDDKKLENEADMMGAKALQMKSDPNKSSQ